MGAAKLDRDDDDEAILQLVTQGDPVAALRIVMDRYGPQIYRYCREALRDESLADDVHQRVFIEAHRDLPKFARRSSLRTWLFAIARHRVLDASKSRRRALAHLGDADADDIVDPRPAPDERIQDAQLREVLAACLDELGEHVRTAVLLRYQQGFSFEEMAGICDDKAGTLQARVTRALPKLRTCIETKTGGTL
ncbi:MAG TPA: RNA polymerase sigma factor [Kofleriaceae bacterium]|nr:RNA polymerase sigma factor [Kofleriaceae bacterium]